MIKITVGGKIFTSILSLIGIGVVAVPTGLLATSIRDTRMDIVPKNDIKKQILNNHIKLEVLFCLNYLNQ
jgi:hypothetical protein